MRDFGKWLMAVLLITGLAACSSGETAGCKPGDYQECYTGADGTQDVGICHAGVAYCDAQGQWGPCLDEQVPMDENCFNNLDDDCDGQANEEGDGCDCEPDSTADCYTGDPATDGVGLCTGGTWTCNPWGTGWGPCEGERLPGPEDYGRTGDENCDGLASADFEWGFLFGADGAEAVSAVVADNSGNVIVGVMLMGELTIGGDEFKSPAGVDSILMKFDAEGNYLWGVQIGDGPAGADEQMIDAITVDDDDSVYVAGGFTGLFNLGGDDLESYTHDDVHLAKFSKDGEHDWSRQLSCTTCTNPPSAGDKRVRDIAIAGEHVIIVGMYQGLFGTNNTCLDGMCKLPLAADDDPFVAMFNRDTGGYFQTTYFTGPGTNYAKKVAVDSNGHFVIAGLFVNSNDVLPGVAGGDWNSYGYSDVFLTKLDENLTPMWHQSLGTERSDYIKGLALDPDDNPVIVATLTDDLNGDSLLVIKLSKNSHLMGPMGAKEWPLLSRHFDDSIASSLDVAEVVMGPDGNLFLGGTLLGSAVFGDTTLAGDVEGDGLVLMLDHSFDPVWARNFGSRTMDSLAGLALGPDRSIFVGGMARDSIDFDDGPQPFGGLIDGFVAKMVP